MSVQVANAQHVGVHVHTTVLNLIHHLTIDHLFFDRLGVDNAKLVRVAIGQALDDGVRLAINQDVGHVGLPKVVGCIALLCLYADKVLNVVTDAYLYTVLRAAHDVEMQLRNRAADTLNASVNCGQAHG